MRSLPFPTAVRPRTIITTDPELDDLNSMIRLLTYANEIDIRGLVYAGSQCHVAGDPQRGIAPYRWPAPGERGHIDQAIDAYAQVEDTLRVHDPRYPSAAHLRSLVRTGNIAAEGEMEEETEGSGLIADYLREIALTPDGATEDDATRPLFIQAWGGISTIARALRSVAEELGGREDWEGLRQRIVDRVVITSFGEQDSTLDSYVRPQWPGLEHREVATETWGYMTRGVLAPADCELASARWTERSISSRGPLGAAYRVWGDGRQMAAGFDREDYFWIQGKDGAELAAEGYAVWCPVQEAGAFISEGDTSNFLLLVPNGLSSWQDATYGGWGGRQTPHPEHADTLTSDMRFHLPDLPGMPELPQPTWPPLVVDHDAEGEAPAEYHATRWWRAAQHDFASRLAWSLTSRFEDANHPPVVSVVGGPSREQCPEGGLRRAVRAGERVRLQAEAADPDGDAVALRWWAYPEAGPRPCPVAPELDDDGQGGAVVSVPQEAEPGQEIHLVVEGTDDGVPALTRYQRVVLVVG